jgi:hypothetical protein
VAVTERLREPPAHETREQRGGRIRRRGTAAREGKTSDGGRDQ